MSGPHRHVVRAELGDDLARRPTPRQQPVGQVSPEVGEVEPGRLRGEQLLGGAAALAGQPLSSWWQCDPGLGQLLLDGLFPGGEL